MTHFLIVSSIIFLLMSPFLYFFGLMAVQIYREKKWFFQLEDEDDESESSSVHS